MKRFLIPILCLPFVVNALDNPSYIDARKNKSVKKDLYIDPKTDTVYTLVPKELLVHLKKKDIAPPQPKVIYGNFEYAKLFESEKPVSQKKSKIDSNKNYFIGASLGVNTFDMSKTNQSGAIEIDTPDEKSVGIKLQGGIYHKNYALYGNYEYNPLDNLDLHALYVSFDYIFQSQFNPYVGFSLGTIQGRWTKDLLVNSAKTKDQKMSSMLYGVQTGIKYPLDDRYEFLTQFSYQKFDLQTDLISTPAKSLIEYKDKKTLEIGVRYRF